MGRPKKEIVMSTSTSVCCAWAIASVAGVTCMTHPVHARVVAHGVVVHPGHRLVMLRHRFLHIA